MYVFYPFLEERLDDVTCNRESRMSDESILSRSSIKDVYFIGRSSCSSTWFSTFKNLVSLGMELQDWWHYKTDSTDATMYCICIQDLHLNFIYQLLFEKRFLYFVLSMYFYIYTNLAFERPFGKSTFFLFTKIAYFYIISHWILHKVRRDVIWEEIYFTLHRNEYYMLKILRIFAYYVAVFICIKIN